MFSAVFQPNIKDISIGKGVLRINVENLTESQTAGPKFLRNERPGKERVGSKEVMAPFEHVPRSAESFLLGIAIIRVLPFKGEARPSHIAR
jgi:hypothetical protein